MSANTDTTGADRTKCKAFCGWRYFDMKMGSVPYESWARSAAWPGPAKDDTVFCSQNCHDARLPPIAAPAAHIERRKGQRWRMRSVNLGADFSGVLAEDAGATWKLSDVVAMDGKGTDRRFRADMWTTPDTTMALLADATPEPAKHNDAIDAIRYALSVPPELAKGEAATIVDCAVKPGWSHFSGVVCECKGTPAKSPPAQEAPKAAPVCIAMGGRSERCATGLPPVARMDGGSKPIMVCDGHWLMREQSIEVSTGFDAAKHATGLTGDPAIGERLPRPQLAADWIEDCLGDVR